MHHLSFIYFLHVLVTQLRQLSLSICTRIANLYAMAVVTFRFMAPPAVGNLERCRRLPRRKCLLVGRLSFWQPRRWMSLACNTMLGFRLATAWATDYLVERISTGLSANVLSCVWFFELQMIQWYRGTSLHARYTHHLHGTFIHISFYSVGTDIFYVQSCLCD